MKRLVTALVAAVMLGASVSATNAAVVFTVQESGDDVLVTASGALDISSLTKRSGGVLGSTIWGSAGTIGVGSVGGGFTNADVYEGLISYPSSFGSGGGINATTGSPNSTGAAVRGDFGLLFVPLGYQSNDILSGSSVYANATLSSLGVIPGTYEYIWATDRVTVNIIPPVPLPAAVWLLLSAVGGLGLAGWHTRKVPTVKHKAIQAAARS